MLRHHRAIWPLAAAPVFLLASATMSGPAAAARLPDRVRRRALAVFGALAEAEGRLHRRPPEQVHFHEVGGLDAIVDVVGTCSALEILDIDVVAASAVASAPFTPGLPAGASEL